jgi:hypothetical protein
MVVQGRMVERCVVEGEFVEWVVEVFLARPVVVQSKNKLSVVRLLILPVVPEDAGWPPAC